MKRLKFILVIFLLSLFFYNTVHAKNNYFADGEKFYNEQKFTKSKFQFEKDIVFNPKNEKSYLYLAKIFKEKKNDIMEEQNLETVILLNPQNEEALYLLALFKIKKSDFKESEALIATFNKVCKKLCNKELELKNKLKNLQPE